MTISFQLQREKAPSPENKEPYNTKAPVARKIYPCNRRLRNGCISAFRELERKPQHELHLPRSAGADRRSGIRTGDLAEGGARGWIGPLDIRIAELRPVEDVEHVRAEAESECARVMREPLFERRVRLPDAGRAQDVSAGIAPRPVRGSA